MARSNDSLGSTAAARRLGISTTTLYRLIDSGVLDAHPIGRRYRVRIEDLDRFLASARITPGSLAHLYAPARSSEAVTGAP